MPKRKTADKEYRDLTQDIDVKILQENIRDFFKDFQDPRRSSIYPAWYLILVILCGYLSGCNTIADNAAENMSLFRRLALNVIKAFDPNRGIVDARRNATYEPAYLSGLLSRLFSKKCQ